jgi:hypothetical protein
MDTRKDNWASKFHESHNRVGRGHRWRGGCEGVECPTTRNEKARARPHSYSVFHATAPTVLAQIIPPIPPNCKRQMDQLGSGDVALTGDVFDLRSDYNPSVGTASIPKRILMVTKWLGTIPAVGVCTFCDRLFYVPLTALKRVADAQESLRVQFAEHKCKSETCS